MYVLPQVNLSGLMVNTVYSVMVALINSNGSGPPSSPEQGTTPMEGGEASHVMHTVLEALLTGTFIANFSGHVEGNSCGMILPCTHI